MRRGEIYRTQAREPDRGDKPGFYVVVSRNFIGENPDVSTVICAPVYSRSWASGARWRSGPARAYRTRAPSAVTF